MDWNALVPELVVADYERSKAFYVDVFGFSVRFERPERGLHFQIEIPSLSGMLERLNKAAIPLASEVVEFVADPDGYLYRFCEYIGERRACPP